MRNSIVEGEPGIFPDPIARVFVAINRWVRRRIGNEQTSSSPPPQSEQSPPSEPSPPERPPPAS